MINSSPAFDSVLVRFHTRVQTDLNEIIEKYGEVSVELSGAFFTEFQTGLFKVAESPSFFHFHACDLRRCNFDRFHYHFFDDVREDYVRVWVVRHNRRNPSWGLKRFS